MNEDKERFVALGEEAVSGRRNPERGDEGSVVVIKEEVEDEGEAGSDLRNPAEGEGGFASSAAASPAGTGFEGGALAGGGRLGGARFGATDIACSYFLK